MNPVPTNWRTVAATKLPRAAAADRVRGNGRYALGTCLDGGTRYFLLFETEEMRRRKLLYWDQGGCRVHGCQDEHVQIDLESFVANESEQEPVASAAG
jgi:hypothetical protein